MAAGDTDVYFEITVIGGFAKVVAIDAATGIEIMAVGPANASRADLERLALNRLKARLARDSR